MATAGELSHRIAWDRRQDIDDGFGNTQADWVEQFITSAKVAPKLGGETVLAARLQSQNTVNITVRQSSKTIQIQPDWRARDVREGKEYAIRSIIDPDDGGAWLELLCQSGVAA
jgi:SPP1 family predicted phage head-tail adaptor